MRVAGRSGKDPRGRKPKWGSATKMFSARLPADVIDWLTTEAKTAGKNRSEFLVELVMMARKEGS